MNLIFKGKELLFFLLTTVFLSCSTLFKDVCDAGDKECLHPTIIQHGETSLGRCPYNKTLVRIHDVSFMTCLKECIKTSRCTSIAYRRNWKICDVIGGTLSDDDFSNEADCLSTTIADWSSEIGGKCSNHACPEGKKCDLVAGHQTCNIVYCIGDPVVPHSVLLERFGLHRTIGHGLKYACFNGWKMTGRPFAVCEQNGSWKTLFSCGGFLVSRGKPTDMTTSYLSGHYTSHEGVDGIKSSGNLFTTLQEFRPSWWVNLEKMYKVIKVIAINRVDCCGERLKSMDIHVGNDLSDMELCGHFDGPGLMGQIIEITCDNVPVGKYVKLTSINNEPEYFSLTEVEVFAVKMTND